MSTRKRALAELRLVQQTKLIPPSKVRALVERDRLLSRALQAVDRRLLLITAGAGYGKTSLLVQVHEKLAQQHATRSWFSLDDGDNDHASFLSHLVATMQRANPSFATALAFTLRAAAPMSAAVLRSTLLNALATIDQQHYVFFDDYHVIVDADVRATLSAILLAPLPQLHFLIATRSRNELPLSRLKTLDQAVEIESADLAFSNLEVSQFIGNASSKYLDAEQLARLRARTEGWAASLQLAAIALNGVDDVAGFLQEFSGESRTVGEFLGDEVLRRQPQYLQEFLLESAILTRFNASLARAVTGRDDSRALIDEAEARNLFIFSLDEQRHWYRYHHLFSDFLQRRLRDRWPDKLEVLHRRAAAWLMDNGLPLEAIEHAFLTSDTAFAGQLLDDSCTQLFAAGQIRSLQKQAARLPREVLLRLPRLQLELTWDYELRWQFRAATDTLARVRAFLRTVQEQGGSALSVTDTSFLESKLAHREMMLALLTDRLPEAYMLARQWTTTTPADEAFMRASVGTTQLHADRERYRCAATPAQAESLHQLFLEGGAYYGTVFHDSACGLGFFMRGELATAEQYYARARQTAIALQGEDTQLTAMPTALLAELRYERGELASARELLARHPAVALDFGFTDFPIARFVTAARLAFEAGHSHDAEATLAAGLQLADQHDLPRLYAHLINESLRQMIASGRGQQASTLLALPRHRAWFTALNPDDQSTSTQELRMLGWARVCIARNEQAQALPVLRRWLAHTHQRDCVRAALRISAVLAALHVSRAETAAARRVIRAALKMTGEGGLLRGFYDQGAGVAAVLEGLRAAAQAAHGSSVSITTGLAGQLTSRELELLRLTAQGMATSDLASALGLTQSTVKWYWQRIFAKLEVHRRFEAVKLARGRGWIV